MFLKGRNDACDRQWFDLWSRDEPTRYSLFVRRKAVE
jgi:hypothetical protein